MITDKAMGIILRNEGFAMHPMWPGGMSGVTWGYGWDSGYHSTEELYADWIDEGRLTCPSSEHQAAILLCVGLTGQNARLHVPRVSECFCLEIDARIVFEQRSLPKYEMLTLQAFPGADQLPADAYSALVSLVFNRGTSMNGESRCEMRDVRAAVAAQDLPAIADAIRSMKRLWLNKGLDGLLSRREEEAQLVEEATA